MTKIPEDDRLDTFALAGILKDTQNSYKHLLFGYLLHELPKRDFRSLVFTPQELQVGMLKVAEFPAMKCNLSLGRRDQTVAILSGARVSSLDGTDLLEWVPFRLLRPFFKEQLKNRPDEMINQSIVQLAEQCFRGPSPSLYRIAVNNRKLAYIEVHANWQEYLVTHLKIIDAWRRWYWASYLQRRNPSALNVMSKLERPNRQTHELNKIREIWRVMSKSDSGAIRCTYSNKQILATDIVVDHYLPWSYLGHDQPWNLCPTTQSINSQKSDKLPAKSNLKSLAFIQHRTLKWMKATQSSKRWEVFSEDYLASLQISEEQLLNQSELEMALEQAISPHYLFAQQMGFKVGWFCT